MPTLDEITLEEDVARRRREAHVATERPRWWEEHCRSQDWRDAYGSLSRRHVLAIIATARRLPKNGPR